MLIFSPRGIIHYNGRLQSLMYVDMLALDIFVHTGAPGLTYLVQVLVYNLTVFKDYTCFWIVIWPWNDKFVFDWFHTIKKSYILSKTMYINLLF